MAASLSRSGTTRPKATHEEVSGHVDEDDLKTYLSHGTSPDHDTGWFGEISTTVSLKKLVEVGADEIYQGGKFGRENKGAFDFAANAEAKLDDKGITSKGETLRFELDGNKITAFVDGNGNDEFDGHHSDRKVFTLELTEHGEFTYTQYDQLDHFDSHGNPIDQLKIDFSDIVNFSDFDKDTITLKDGSLTIKIDDDNPIVFGNQHKIVVDEDGLPDGNPYGPGDQGVPAPQNEDSGKLKFKVGADEPADIDFADMDGDPVKDKHGNDITSDGAALEYVWDQSTHTLSAQNGGR